MKAKKLIPLYDVWGNIYSFDIIDSEFDSNYDIYKNITDFEDIIERSNLMSEQKEELQQIIEIARDNNKEYLADMDRELLIDSLEFDNIYERPESPLWYDEEREEAMRLEVEEKEPK